MEDYKNFYNEKKNNSIVCSETKNNFVTHFLKKNKLKSKKIDNLNV